ncbi:hypothetical protein V2J09_015901 [Rumex salicifolius]
MRNEKPPQEKGGQIFDKSSSHEEKISKSVAHFLSCLEEKPAKLGSESKSGNGVGSSTSDKSRYHAALRLQKTLDWEFFKEHGTALSKWSRARTKAAKVGKGLSKDEKARKLALQHWLEAIPDIAMVTIFSFIMSSGFIVTAHSLSSTEFRLDIGEGKEVDLERCSRAKLQQQCIKYLGPDEREDYEVAVVDGKSVLDTSREPKGTKCIFVLSTCKTLYVGQKVKGHFQHSSFLAGGATLSAGRLVLEDGFLKKDPIDDDEESHQKKEMTHRREPSRSWEIKFDILTDIEPHPTGLKEEQKDENSPASTKPQLPKLRIPAKKNVLEAHVVEQKQDTPDLDYKTDSSSSGYETAEDSLLEDMDIIYSKMKMFNEDEEEEPKDPTPKEMMVKRLNNHRRTRSYQLADQLSFNWTTGAGPRIGCLRDYPSRLQFRAMEHVNLSPRGKRLSSPGSGPIGLKTDLYKFGSLGAVPELPKLGSVPEFNSPVSSSSFNKESSD